MKPSAGNPRPEWRVLVVTELEFAAPDLGFRHVAMDRRGHVQYGGNEGPGCDKQNERARDDDAIGWPFRPLRRPALLHHPCNMLFLVHNRNDLSSENPLASRVSCIQLPARRRASCTR